MLRLQHFAATFAAAVVGFLASNACAQQFTADLQGVNEIGSIPSGAAYAQSYTGAVRSDGTGTVQLNLDQAGTVAYTLTYSNVGTRPPKTGTVLFAHIHYGKSGDSGGVLVFFCTNSAFTGTGPTPPPCPTNSGTVSGTWTAANVQAIPGQNVNAGDFGALVDALNSNTAYANVHQTAYPGGEIRGQVVLENQGEGNGQGH